MIKTDRETEKKKTQGVNAKKNKKNPKKLRNNQSKQRQLKKIK